MSCMNIEDKNFYKLVFTFCAEVLDNIEDDSDLLKLMEIITDMLTPREGAISGEIDSMTEETANKMNSHMSDSIHDMKRRKQALIDMMRGDEEIGLYDDNPKNHGYESKRIF